MSRDMMMWQWKRQGADPLRVLTALVHLSPAFDMARCQMVTAFMFALWQASGRALTPSPPSFLMVHAGDGLGPVWKALSAILSPLLPGPAVQKAGDPTSFLQGNPVLCRQTMQAAVAVRRKLVAANAAPAVIASEVNNWLPRWRTSKAELFPSLEVRNFGEPLDQELGLVTHYDDSISLLIHDSNSLKRLQGSLAKDPGHLNSLQGVGDDFATVPKQVALMGGITAAQWDPGLVSGLLESGIPFFFLPHATPDALTVPNLGLLKSMMWTFARHHRFHCAPARPDVLLMTLGEDIQCYSKIIARLSTHLPGDYAFNIQVILRMLREVVARFCWWAMPLQGQPTQDQVLVFSRLLVDLQVTVARGLAYGTAALGFHGNGNGILSDGGNGMKVVAFLREEGRPRSRRDIQRKVYRLKSRERDEVIAELERAGLVSLDDEYVEAVSLPDYLAGIPKRERFPAATLLSAPTRGKR